MEKSVRIRPFQDADAQQVTALWRDVFAYDSPHNEPTYTIECKRAVQRELFFIAEQQGSVVGTVMGGYDGHRGWIYSLAVAAESRRMGVGTALIRHIEQALIQRGCPKINLQVIAGNDEAVAFYQSLGFNVEPRISLGKIIRTRR